MRTLLAKDIMNPRLLIARDDMTVAEVAEFLVDHELSGAPVADMGGKLIGVISVTDIAHAAAQGSDPQVDCSDPGFYLRGWEETLSSEEIQGFRLADKDLLARDIMTPSIYSVPEDTPVADVAEIMVDSHIHRLLVTRGNNTVGIISSSDLLGLLVEKPS